MQIIEWSQFLEDTSPLKGNPFAVTVGIFDGVHRGHKALIEAVVAQKKHTVPVVITFRQGRNKKAFGGDEDYPGDILSFRQKMAIFESLGVVLTIVVDFSESFMRMSGTEFLRILTEHGKMIFMAVGSNFRCGYRLDTDALAIKKFNDQQNIETRVVQPLTEKGRTISSSQIRSAITHGKLSEAESMLGRPFIVDLFNDDLSINIDNSSADVSVFSSDMTAAGSVVYDIAGQGRILPPPGRYKVLLLNNNCEQGNGTPTEIEVDEKYIVIKKGNCYHFVEFLC